MMKKGATLAILAIYGVTAAVWLIGCVRDMVTGGQADGLQVLVALVWCFGFAVLLRRYLNNK